MVKVQDFKSRLTSRKFLLTVAVGLVIVINKAFNLGFTDAQIGDLVTAVAAYVGVEGIADAVRAYQK